MMRGTVSIEASLLEDVDRVAGKLGLSRGRVVSLALEDYLPRHRDREITEKLNSVYADRPGPSGIALLAGMKAKFRSTL